MGLFKRSKPTPDTTVAESSTSTSRNAGAKQDADASTSNLSTTSTLVPEQQEATKRQYPTQPSRDLTTFEARRVGIAYLKSTDPEYDEKLTTLLNRIERNSYVPKPPKSAPRRKPRESELLSFLTSRDPWERYAEERERREEEQRRLWHNHQEKEGWAMMDIRDMSLSRWRAKYPHHPKDDLKM
jgi:hypothetical protein